MVLNLFWMETSVFKYMSFHSYWIFKNIFEKTIELEWVTLLNTMTNVVSLFLFSNFYWSHLCLWIEDKFLHVSIFLHAQKGLQRLCVSDKIMGWTKILLIYKQTYRGWKYKDLQDLHAPKSPFVLLYSIYV